MTEPPPLDQLLFTPTEAARALSIGRSTMYRLLEEGEIDTFRWLGKRLIRRETLVALIDRLAAQSKPR